MNNTNLIGRLVNEPELRYVAGSGVANVKFTIAIDRKMSKAKKEEARKQGNPTADFLRVIIWNQTAEFVANHAHKGTMIAINGEIRTGSYEGKDGKKVYTTEILADSYGGVEILSWEKKEDLGMKAEKFEDGFKELEIDEQIPF